MTRILGKQNPVKTDTVFTAKVGKCLIGDFAAPFDNGKVLWIEVQRKCNVAIFYFGLLCLLYKYDPYPLHDIMKNNHGTPLW